MSPGKRDAARTCIQQVKVIISLALVFILLTVFTMIYRTPVGGHFYAVTFLVSSVLVSYVTLGSIAGFQHLEKSDVYRPTTRFTSGLQLLFCVIGIIVYLVFLPGALQ